MLTLSEIETAVAGGESETVEFKATTGQRTEAARTLSAMLNGRGGAVIFGVKPNGQVSGQDVSDSTLEDITHACRDIRPAFPPSIARIDLGDGSGKQVIVASVSAGTAKPYAFKGNYHTRSGSSTVPMPAETEVTLMLERAHGLDRWETQTSERTLDHLDQDLIKAFRDDAIVNNRAQFSPAADTENILRALALLDKDNRPNRGAIALFGDSDGFGAEYMMLAVHFVAVDGIELGEHFVDETLVEGNVFALLERSMSFCAEHLRHPVTIGDGLQAVSDLEIPTVVLREAMANALAHRDYSTPGHVQLRVFTDRVEILSPGGLHFGLAASDLYRLHASYPWNPNILGCLYRRGVVEQLGTGTLRMIRRCLAAGLGSPVFTSIGAGVAATIARSGYRIGSNGRSVELSESEEAVLLLLDQQTLRRGELAAETGLNENTLRDLLSGLRDLGLVHLAGYGRGARWSTNPEVGWIGGE